MFNAVFNNISVIKQWPVHLSIFSWSSFTIFCPSHRLLSHKSNVKTMDSSERGMNPVAMTLHQSSEINIGDYLRSKKCWVYHSPFKSPLPCDHKHIMMFCKGLKFNINPLSKLSLSQTNPYFYASASKSLLKTRWIKEKLFISSNFSFSHSILKSFP